MTAETSGEYRGKTVEAAISAGLAALRLSKDEVEIEVVRQGSRGVLGIGAEDAIVRLTPVKPAAVEPQAAPTPGRSADLVPRSHPTPAIKSEVRGATPVPPTPTASQGDGRPGAALGSPGQEKGWAGAQRGREILAGLLERLNLDADVEIVSQSDAEVEEGRRAPVLNIVGDDLGVLIGRQNETLAALEFLTRLMVNQQTRSHAGFSVDVNGYRARRAESLRKLALRMAEQARQTGRTVVLEPMPPAERRIIHLALQEHPAVTTQSVGEGDHRKVTVIPRKG